MEEMLEEKKGQVQWDKELKEVICENEEYADGENVENESEGSANEKVDIKKGVFWEENLVINL